jgi:hypothetical protein
MDRPIAQTRQSTLVGTHTEPVPPDWNLFLGVKSSNWQFMILFAMDYLLFVETCYQDSTSSFNSQTGEASFMNIDEFRPIRGLCFEVNTRGTMPAPSNTL